MSKLRSTNAPILPASTNANMKVPFLGAKKQPLGSSLSINSSSTCASAASAAATNQAVVSITCSLGAAEQCIKQNVQNQVKKKRTALENISNASGNQNGSVNNTLEVTKKSRFGNSVPTTTNTSTLPNALASVAAAAANSIVKKTETHLVASKKTVTKEIKENVNTLLHQPIIKKTATSIVQQARNSLKPITNVASKAIPEPTQKESTKIEQQKIDTQNELNIERKLATTTLSSSQQESEVAAAASNKLTADQITDWEDIDTDEADEFSANTYVSYIFKYYREREEKFKIGDYIKKQPINKQMRLLLVDWMVEVQQQLEFNHEVLYLSVKLLDLYLNSCTVQKEKLQLLGGAAMFIACKFEERMPPIIDDFVYVSDNAYDRNDLIKMEIDILKTVQFDIGVPLSYTFLRRYSKCIKADMKFLTLARYILELSLQDYSFCYVLDSLKACAALYLAMKMCAAYEKNLKEQDKDTDETLPACVASSTNLTSNEWNATLIHYTGSFLNDFIGLIPAMNNLLITAPASKYKTIYKKYSHQVFYEVAKIPALSEADLETLADNCEKNHQELLAAYSSKN